MISPQTAIVPILALLGAGALVACGSTPPPKELLDARTAYARAQSGQAAQLNPAEVHEAKVFLDNAEQSFLDSPGSDKTRNLSYVAERKAEWAEARAGVSAADRDREQAIKDLEDLQSQGYSTVKGELATAKVQLEKERQARIDAEKRAKDAFDKLAVAGALAIKDEPRGTVITLPGNVLFQSGKDALRPEAQQKLDAIALALKDQEDRKMVVEGHTDSQGSVSSNIELSQRRAQTVRDYLVSKGVPSDKIAAQGIGQARPIADNSSVEGRASNRRVEIIIQPIEKR